jgi:alpha-mannosidase
MKYFFTQKLSWNNINNFPHSTFNWVAIDGTQVLTHMTPVDTYTAQATVSDVQRAVRNHKNLESTDKGLLVFGNGDGGGGPLSKMLENLRRIRAAGNNSRDIPIVGMGASVDDFFKQLEQDTNGGKTLPAWHGELYFEFHRGTYTSHGSIKRGNRKSEILVRDAEHLATLASLHDASYEYPRARLDECWEKTLLNQFHDVLPGSSIAMVYDDAEKLYSEVHEVGTAIIEEALEVLLGHSIPLLNADLIQSKTRGSIIGLNTTPFPRMEVVELPLTQAYKARFKPEVVQVSKDKTKGYILVDGTRGAGLASATGMYAEFKPASAYQTSSGDFVLKNSNIEMKISDGRIVSLFDVELERELIPEGQTGGMVIFDDRPNYWDAWDVEFHHLETPHPLKFSNVRLASVGPVRAAIEAEVVWGQSTINVTISLDAITATTKANSRSLIRFDAKVDWQQKHEFLKFEIPLNIRSDTATYECQFGNIKRPTHYNTTWEAAKFEVCGHKYADLSEYGYGVALLNESKYGYATTGNIMRLSLLRAATAPDAHQDEGKHEFSWAIYPHAGHFMESDVPTAAYLFNSPIHLRYALEDTESQLTQFVYKTPFLVDHTLQNVILETMKRGDDDVCTKNSTDPQTVVLRMYEAYGGAARIKLRISSKIRVIKATLTNLLEDDIETLDTLRDDGDDTILQLDFRAFQVVTVKLTVGPPSASESPATKVEGWIKLNRV